MKRIITSTPEGFSGIDRNYSEEIEFGNKLLKILPEDWKVEIDWVRSLMADFDVRYLIEKEDKLVRVQYSQGLHRWTASLLQEVASKV